VHSVYSVYNIKYYTGSPRWWEGIWRRSADLNHINSTKTPWRWKFHKEFGDTTKHLVGIDQNQSVYQSNLIKAIIETINYDFLPTSKLKRTCKSNGSHTPKEPYKLCTIQ
jgi:hypothetical protein